MMHPARLAMGLIIAGGLAVYYACAIAAPVAIGFVAPDEEPRYTDLLTGLRQGLQRSGAANWEFTIFEHRVKRRDTDAARSAAESLRARHVRAAFVVGTELTQSIREVTKDLPIVFITPGDPVRPGVAASLAQPGNNLTGMTFEFPELSGKRLEMLKEINPSARTVGVVYDRRDASPRQGFVAAKSAAKRLGVQLVEMDVQSMHAGQARPALWTRVDGLILIPGGAVSTVAESAIRFAATMRVASVVWTRSAATREATLSYGVNDVEVAREAARLVARVVNGYPAGNLPIERPTRFELVVNLKTAKALGIEIPPAIMVRADRLIE